MNNQAEVVELKGKLLPLLVPAYALGAAYMVARELIRHGSHPDVRVLFIKLAGVGVLLPIVLAASISYFRYRASPAGMRGWSAWGQPVELAWDQIQDARVLRFPGGGWLRLRGTDGRVAWLCSSVLHDDRVRALVQRHADPAGPLARLAAA